MLYEVITSEIDNDSFLSVPRKPILIGDEIISVYVYESNKDMEQDSKYIGKDGCSIFRPGNSVEISWVSLPHFFKKDTLIINYRITSYNVCYTKLLRGTIHRRKMYKAFQRSCAQSLPAPANLHTSP